MKGSEKSNRDVIGKRGWSKQPEGKLLHYAVRDNVEHKVQHKDLQKQFDGLTQVIPRGKHYEKNQKQQEKKRKNRNKPDQAPGKEKEDVSVSVASLNQSGDSIISYTGGKTTTNRDNTSLTAAKTKRKRTGVTRNSPRSKRKKLIQARGKKSEDEILDSSSSPDY